MWISTYNGNNGFGGFYVPLDNSGGACDAACLGWLIVLPILATLVACIIIYWLDI